MSKYYQDRYLTTKGGTKSFDSPLAVADHMVSYGPMNVYKIQPNGTVTRFLTNGRHYGPGADAQDYPIFKMLGVHYPFEPVKRAVRLYAAGGGSVVVDTLEDIRSIGLTGGYNSYPHIIQYIDGKKATEWKDGTVELYSPDLMRFDDDIDRLRMQVMMEECHHLFIKKLVVSVDGLRYRDADGHRVRVQLERTGFAILVYGLAEYYIKPLSAGGFVCIRSMGSDSSEFTCDDVESILCKAGEREQ